MERILIFDNYDSFTYNLVHLVEKLLHRKVDVCKNDEYALDSIGGYDKIILSPGPGLPNEAGLLCDVIREFYRTKSILGVCLGHQAIGEVLGGRLRNLDGVFHGVAHEVDIMDGNEKLFKGLGNRITVGRYHSWVIDTELLPADLIVTAKDSNGNIMGIRHRNYDLRGVQFHPESILTPMGEKIISNWLFE